MQIKIQTIPQGPLGTNCYLLTDVKSGESAVIDPGGCDGVLEEFLSKLTVKYILLTHGHFDHILGVSRVRALTGAKVAVHTLDADCLTDESKSLCSWECPGQQTLTGADILLSEGDVLYLGETAIRVMHTPGHTRGGVCYILESERILFSGDTLFCLTAGRTDFEGGSTEALMQSLRRLADLEGDYTVYPGHNRSTTLAFERVKNRYMRRLGDSL